MTAAAAVEGEFNLSFHCFASGESSSTAAGWLLAHQTRPTFECEVVRGGAGAPPGLSCCPAGITWDGAGMDCV